MGTYGAAALVVSLGLRAALLVQLDSAMPLTITGFGYCPDGTLYLDSAFNITFVPTSMFVGARSFEYYLDDGYGGTQKDELYEAAITDEPITIELGIGSFRINDEDTTKAAVPLKLKALVRERTITEQPYAGTERPEVLARYYVLGFADTAEVLAAYARQLGSDPDGWVYLTGTSDEIAAVARAYGVVFQRKPDGEVVHNLLTSICDRGGNLRVQYMGMAFNPDEFAHDVRDLIAEVDPP